MRACAIRMSMIVVLVLLVLAVVLPAAAQRTSQGARSPEVLTLLKPARVFDAEDGKIRAGWVVLVRGERIAAAGPAEQVAVPDGTQTIDLPGMTLLPGLMDIHSHIFLHPYNETLSHLQTAVNGGAV